MCSTDFDTCDVFRQSRVGAGRKPRKCYECGLPIPVGAPYMKTFSVFEGNADTYSVHVECDAVSDFVRDEICRAEHDTEQMALPAAARSRFDGVILVGGLDEELHNLAGYTFPATAEDAADAAALGFTVDDDGDGCLTYCPAQIAEWMWDVARATYTSERV